MHARLLATLVLTVLAHGAAAAQTPAHRARALYDSLEARLIAGDTTIDYRALRLAYVETLDYDPYGVSTGEVRERMMNAYYRQQDPTAAREAAEALLGNNYVDMDAHMIVALTSASLKDMERARFHASVARGLAASIEQPGSGTQPETPYDVISVVEEDALFRMRGLERLSQTVTTCRGQPCDRVEVRQPSSGDTRVLYFDISRARAFLERNAP